MLFVPADSDKKLAKGMTSPADVLILDLEDAVAEAHKPVARRMAAEFISAEAERIGPRLFVRINPLDTSFAMADLASVVVPGLAGIEPRSVRIVPVATETAEAMLTMPSWAQVTLPRLAGITWGAEDLSAAVGAVSNRDENGEYSPLYSLANALCLAAATAAGVPPIDTVHVDFRDSAGLAAACRASRRRGFRGRIAIHPDQVPIIHDAYTPSATELAHAKRIVDAFAANPDAGTLNLDGTMIDRPHLTQALRTLEQAS